LLRHDFSLFIYENNKGIGFVKFSVLPILFYFIEPLRDYSVLDWVIIIYA